MWKNININRNLIESETFRCVTICMPHSSEYDGYSFSHPSKLVRSGRNKSSVSIGYTDDFKFRLEKHGKGKFNKFEVLDKQEINAAEFEEAFGVVNENIIAPTFKSDYETHKPTLIKPVTCATLEELKDE